MSKQTVIRSYRKRIATRYAKARRTKAKTPIFYHYAMSDFVGMINSLGIVRQELCKSAREIGIEERRKED